MAMESPALTTGPVKTQWLAMLESVLGGCRRGFERLIRDLRPSCEDEKPIIIAESLEGLSYQLFINFYWTSFRWCAWLSGDYFREWRRRLISIPNFSTDWWSSFRLTSNKILLVQYQLIVLLTLYLQIYESNFEHLWRLVLDYGLGLLDELQHFLELPLLVTGRVTCGRHVALWEGLRKLLSWVVPVVIPHGVFAEELIVLETPSTDLAKDEDAAATSIMPLL
mgnify:CR=1 FL=1